MRRAVVTTSRLLLETTFFVFGLNGLFGVIPTPSVELEAATFPASYLLKFVKVVETACGLLLLANRFVPLATAAIAPVVVNILLFHVFVDTGGLVVAIPLLLMNAVLAVAYRGAFAGLLKMRAEPDSEPLF